jgi:pyroglutamyl-peptidase
MTSGTILLTGFEPYGGRGLNPAYETMKELDGRVIEGLRVVGRSLPVSLKDLKVRLSTLIDEVRPAVVVSVGLWPGEAMIRLERVGVNIVDYEIPDNDGLMIHDDAVSSNAQHARFATLPLRAIEAALIEDGIPVRISPSAGTFLCNACLFTLLDYLAAHASRVPAGFIHVPYVPEQVAMMISDLRSKASLEIHQRADMASMEQSRIIRGVELAIATTVKEMRLRPS